MINVCQRCFPSGYPHHGPLYGWLSTTCDVCGRSRPTREMKMVSASAADIRFENWKRTYERGPEERAGGVP